ncbi:MAG TPA: homogentisate 1,2-dioxygenase [Fimbriimonadaceae bacterium]|nr:homogentisate 1,2-dioxygenase [Fimbriimonadaceae bacterium]
MPRYVRLGELPRKHHIQFRKPDGGLYAEQLFSTRGFSGPMSTLYHINLPTEVGAWEDRGSVRPHYLEDEPLRHRHLKTSRLKPCGDAVSGRLALMGNQDVEWNQVFVAEQMDSYYKNADGDECLFIHDGDGTMESLFGTIHFKKGDYLVIPRGTIYKLAFDKLPVRMLAIVSFGPIEIPKRYRNEYGQLLEHAPYTQRDIRPPTELPVHGERRETQVLIRARHHHTMYTYPYHPLDVIGWDGYVFPFAFNIMDFQPITGQLHMPPPIHQTFQGHNFVVCSFCPRMLDYHPEAIAVPYNHSNIDSDEVLYYCNDKFGSRKGIEEGSITLHPLGIPHGPQPGAVEASLGAQRTEELAVMVDTFHPFKVTQESLQIEDPDYWKSWSKPSGAPVPGQAETTGD